MSALLEIEGLTIEAATSGGPVTLVEGLSIAVDRGEILGLIGESGSGKTTTARAIIGMLESNLSVTAGGIRLAGSEVSSAASSQVRAIRGRDVGFIFQGAGSSLDPLLRVDHQLGEVVKRHRRDVTTRERRGAVIRQSLVEMGFTDPDRVARSYPHQLSGGMRQRVSIALAMVAKPKLLIADECTSALDVTTQKEVVQLLTRLVAESGVGMLFVTHDLVLAEEICTTIAVLRHGRLVEYNTAEQLIRAPQAEYTRELLAAVPRW